jgi:glycosyltransferase involved in cell wall biosynthesis
MNEILLSVIVPTYNEGNLLMTMAQSLSLHLDGIPGKGAWQFVIVSNGCRDNTPEIISKITDLWPQTIAVHLAKSNYGDALRAGLAAAKGKWAYIVNVDHWESEFLFWAWQHRDAYDMFIGSRRADPTLDMRSKYRKLLTWGLNVILQIFFGVVVTDTHGQKLLNLEVLRPILDECIMSRGQFDTEFVLRSQRKGLKIAELPVPISEKRKQRNLMLQKILQNLIDIVRLKMVMNKVPVGRGIHYHRFSRFDLDMQAHALHFSQAAD